MLKTVWRGLLITKDGAVAAKVQVDGQAGSGCYQAARYLRLAAQAALGGE